ncbi:MAG: cyclic nucleotide-binding domain-containing protein [Cyanobacteria bacterium P01_H01_bin.121]
MRHQPILSIRHLDHYLGQGDLRTQTLFDINLELWPGEFVILTGPSGSGKSTLLSLIGGLRTVQAGRLVVLGRDLQQGNDVVRAQTRRQLGYIFQASNLLGFLSARRNLQIVLELQTDLTRAAIEQQAQRLLETVGLGDRADHLPNQLSGGQKQRLAIACALAAEPQLILADEPTAALDSQSGRKIVELLHRLAKEQGGAVLMITHDPRILDVADRIIQMKDGQLELAYTQELALSLPGLQAEQLESVSIQPAALTYEPGTYIFRQGDRAESFYVLIQGEVEIWQEQAGQPPRLLNRLRRGDYFGEIGILQQGNRTASVRVAPDHTAKLLVLKREAFLALMGTSDLTTVAIEKRLQERLSSDMIRHALPAIDTDAIVAILPEVERLRYGPGSNIIRQGSQADQVYIVLTGTAEAIYQDSHGRESCVNRLRPGDFFGEIGVMNAVPRTATVRALTDSPVEVLAIPGQTFQTLLAQFPASETELAKVIYDRSKMLAHLQ